MSGKFFFPSKVSRDSCLKHVCAVRPRTSSAHTSTFSFLSRSTSFTPSVRRSASINLSCSSLCHATHPISLLRCWHQGGQLTGDATTQVGRGRRGTGRPGACGRARSRAKCSQCVVARKRDAARLGLRPLQVHSCRLPGGFHHPQRHRRTLFVNPNPSPIRGSRRSRMSRTGCISRQSPCRKHCLLWHASVLLPARELEFPLLFLHNCCHNPGGSLLAL